MGQKRILFVDDELHILKALRRLFATTDYETFFADSGKEALAILKEETVDLVISDMRMPEMDGYQLLKQVKALYPMTMRVILSGYAEDKEIIRALQDGSTKMYLLKPWDNDKLMLAIEQLFALRDLFESKHLLEMLNGLEGLPTLPAIYNRVCRLIEENADIEKIAALIEEDQAITAKVLQVANSVFYGSKTGSVKQAIVYLGLANVRNIVLSISVIHSCLSPTQSVLSREILWKHVSLTNRLVHRIYEQLLKKTLPGVSATAGLLHDIGRLVLIQRFPQEYEQVVQKVRHTPGSIVYEMENELLHISHQEVSGCLLNWWGMPHSIVEAATFHHTPFDARVMERELVCVVHLADYYAWRSLNVGITPYLDTDVFSFLQLEQAACEELVERLLKQEVNR